MKRFLTAACTIMLICAAGIPISSKAQDMASLKDKLMSIASSPPAHTPSAAADSNNKFGASLLANISRGERNTLVSPYSAFAALTLTAEGAKGQTAEEMLRALAMPGGKRLSDKDLQSLAMEDPGTGNTLKSANALWIDSGYKLEPAFLQTARQRYAAEARELAMSSSAAAGQINGWVENQTNGKIHELIKDTAGARLIITNALYLKADWAFPFKASATHDGNFYLSSGKTTEVRMMEQKRELFYADTDSSQVLELPYSGQPLAAVVILPHKNTSLADTEKSLSADGFKHALESVLGKDRASTQVIVRLPKFKIEDSHDLVPMLRTAGMNLAFAPEADLSGIAPKDKDGNGLFISQVIQKTFIEVGEKGTEAAAATAVVMPEGMAMPQKTPPVVSFIADRPFIFLVVQKKSGAILFASKVVNPAEE